MTNGQDDSDTAKRVRPVVELDSDQMEALFGRLPEEGESLEATVTVTRVRDSGNYELEVDREEPSSDDEITDAALGYPRSKLFPRPASPDVSAKTIL